VASCFGTIKSHSWRKRLISRVRLVPAISLKKEHPLAARAASSPRRARSKDITKGCTTPGKDSNGNTLGDTAIILTRSLETVSVAQSRDSSSSLRSAPAMRFKDQREPHRGRVVECAIFATRNSLKSLAARNIKSPFSNIHAVISKLRWDLRPT
jgi:hypothetical protein